MSDVFLQVGIASGPHGIYRTMATVDYASLPDKKWYVVH